MVLDKMYQTDIWHIGIEGEVRSSSFPAGRVLMRHGDKYNRDIGKYGCGWWMSYGEEGNRCVGCHTKIPDDILTLYTLYTGELPRWDQELTEFSVQHAERLAGRNAKSYT